MNLTIVSVQAFAEHREMRDRAFKNQRHRDSELTLFTAAVTLWNIVSLDRAVRHLRGSGTKCRTKCCPRRAIGLGKYLPHRRLSVERNRQTLRAVQAAPLP